MWVRAWVRTLSCRVRSPRHALPPPSPRSPTHPPTHPPPSPPRCPPQPDEYEKLGSYALCGLPDELYPQRYVEVDSMKTDYPIIIGGQNFGCGSSREHAPVALGAAGATVVVAESYARIFFRNCVST